MVENDRIPHALMLLGMPGSGALSLAMALAQNVLCENRTGGDACGTCRSCAKTSKLIHPDLHFSFPTVGCLGCVKALMLLPVGPTGQLYVSPGQRPG